MPADRILVVEDDPDIQELLAYNFSSEGYHVDCVGSGEAALRRARASSPDLVVLDLMLPEMNGLDVCKELKQDPETRPIPIIMVTAKGEESDIVAGLELGADDYITKPFSPRVVIARVRAVLRRGRQAEASDTAPLVRGDLKIEPARHQVWVGEDEVELTVTEFQVLCFLAGKPGRVFTRQQIVDHVKGEDYAVTERSVDVQMVGLRKKLASCAKYIETIRGIGYRFKD